MIFEQTTVDLIVFHIPPYVHIIIMYVHYYRHRIILYAPNNITIITSVDKLR